MDIALTHRAAPSLRALGATPVCGALPGAVVRVITPPRGCASPIEGKGGRREVAPRPLRLDFG